MPKTLNPQWREQFDFHLYEERGGIIDITTWDKDAGKRDDFIGRFVKLGVFCFTLQRGNFVKRIISFSLVILAFSGLLSWRKVSYHVRQCLDELKSLFEG